MATDRWRATKIRSAVQWRAGWLASAALFSTGAIRAGILAGVAGRESQRFLQIVHAAAGALDADAADHNADRHEHHDDGEDNDCRYKFGHDGVPAVRIGLRFKHSAPSSVSLRRAVLCCCPGPGMWHGIGMCILGC